VNGNQISRATVSTIKLANAFRAVSQAIALS